MTIYVLTHAGCYDGFGASFSAWLKFGDGATYIPVQHGRPPPEIPKNSTVYIADFAYPRKILLEMKTNSPDLVVLDHHITAKDDLEGLDFAIFDMEKSGAGLAWEYFHPEKPMPALIKHIQDRDLWKFELGENTSFLHTVLVATDMRFEVWQKLMLKLEDPGTAKRVFADGKAMYQFQQTNVKKICGKAFFEVLGGYNIPMVNTSCSWSEVGHFLLDKYPEAPFVASYTDKDDGMRLWSLRSRKDFDCSEIAKKYGGGGHKQASGFIAPRPKVI